MKQLKYSLRDIRNHKGFYLSTTIQLTITFIILGYALTQIFVLSNGMQKLNSLSEKDTYVIRDTTTDAQLEKIYSNTEQSLDKLRLFFEKIDNYEDIYIYWKYHIPVERNTYETISLTANKNFLNLYGIETCKGRMFLDEDYQYSDDCLPVLIGYDLQHLYKLGETYIISDGSREVEAKVIGILKNNSTYLSLSDFSEISLNNTIVFPFSQERLLQSEEIPDYDMALQSMIMISDGKESLEKISLSLQETDTFFMRFEKLDQSLKKLVDYLSPQIEYEIIIASIILFFSMFGLISNLFVMMNNNMVEYAVHMYCGASVYDIIKRILIQIGLVIIVSLIPIVIFCRWKVILSLLGIAVLLFVFVMPFIFNRLCKQKVTDVIRRFS